jgi:ATP-dependent Clp protease ATP-binding subunit ClpC
MAKNKGSNEATNRENNDCMRPSYTEGVHRLLSRAQAAAGRDKHRFVHTEHVLLGLLSGKNSALRIITHLGGDPERIRRACEKRCQRGDHEMEDLLKMTPRVQHVMALAGEEAQAAGDTKLDTRHVLLGLLLEEEGIAGNVLRASGLTAEDVRAALKEIGRDPERAPEPTAEHARHRKRHARNPIWKFWSRAKDSA